MKPLVLHPGSKSIILILLYLCLSNPVASQTSEILPPVVPWKGKSLNLIVKKDHPWITPVEKSDFVKTPSYQETHDWLQRLCDKSENLRMISAGKSANNRDIYVVIASGEKKFEKNEILNSTRPLLLIQAGIHAGEIDGKDAGMMLLRDISAGSKRDLLDGVDILFISILNVDGHERTSEYNRVNQRGPSNMGWRTNARNLNLNRDYSKLDTEEIRAVASLMTEYGPDLYLDLHVTDGADYQYDITYGFSKSYSPAIGVWLTEKLTPAVDQHLKNNGHIPGPLIFAANDKDFSNGLVEFGYSTRFSNNYGDIRHIPSILVENHSLKPFKQRVLGTYIFLEAVIRIMKTEGPALMKAIEQDQKQLKSDVVLTWKRTEPVDTISFLGIESERVKSQITGADVVQWKGKPITQRVPVVRFDTPDKTATRPRAYWIPATYKNVIERLRQHGLQMEEIKETKTIPVTMYKVVDHKFASQPFEGHFSVSGNFRSFTNQEVFYPGSVRIDARQPLGDLAMHLLEPGSPDSFLQWGFFSEIFNRTEYIEEYAIEPLAKRMMSANPKLKDEFENWKKNNPVSAAEPRNVYQWFYERSPYIDNRYLIYPVGREE